MFRALFRRALTLPLVGVLAFSLGTASIAAAAQDPNGVPQRLAALEQQVAVLVSRLTALEANTALGQIEQQLASLVTQLTTETSQRLAADTSLGTRVTALEGARIQVATAQATPGTIEVPRYVTETYYEAVPVYSCNDSGCFVVGYRNEARTRVVVEYDTAVGGPATANAQCPAGTVVVSGQGAATQTSGAPAVTASRAATASGGVPTSLDGHTGWVVTATFTGPGTVYARAFCTAP